MNNVKLGEISTVQRGLTFSKKDTVDYSKNIVLRATNIDLETGKLNFNELKYLKDDFVYDHKYRVEKSSILICFSSGSKSHLGKVALVTDDIEMAYGGFIGKITPKETVDPKYLFYNLRSEDYVKYIGRLTDGANINNLKMADLLNYSLRFPSLPKQKQIVENLDKAFEKINKAIANVERNIQNAEELFQSKLEQIFSETDGSSDISWKYLTFDNLVSSTQIGIVRNTKEQSVDFPVRYFKMNNIKNNNGIDDSKYTSINATENEIRKYSLKNGDFLFNTRNSYELVGKTCVFRSSYNGPIVFNNNILRARFKDFVNSDFVAYAFCTEKVKIKLNSIKNGTTSVVGIYYKSLKDLKIPIPPLSEQKKIVESLDNLNNHVQSIIMKYKKELINLEELKKSILEKAFKGELTSAA